MKNTYFFICAEILYDKEEKEGKQVGIHAQYVMNQLEEGKWKEIKREIQQEMKKNLKHLICTVT